MIPSTNLHQFDVHNDGYFSHLLLTYVGGVILEMDVQRMPYEEFAVYLEEKCGCYFQGLYYQVLSQDLDRGLVRVSDDRSLSYMFDVEETFGRLNLYIDHLDMDLSEYLNDMVDWAEMEVDATDGVKARTCTIEVDVTNGIDATDGVDAIDKGKEKYDSDDDSDYQSDKSADYLSLGEEELIELRNRMKANREAKAKAKDNLVFEMNELNNKNSMPADNVRGETFEEHDIYMNQLLKSLNTTDKDEITKDPFISVEKHMERVGEKYISVAQFHKSANYYAWHMFSLCGMKGVEWMTDEKTFQCISLEDEHTCVRNFNFGSLVNYKWIEKCTNAKKYALTEYEKAVGKHYAMLRSYAKAILDSNLGSIVKLGVTVNPYGKTYFYRFYVCFAGLANGWKAGCRSIIDFFLMVVFLKRHTSHVKYWYSAIRTGWELTTIYRRLGHVAAEEMDKLLNSRTNGLIYITGKLVGNGKPEVCPNIKKRLEWLKEQQRIWHVIPAGGKLFDVRSGSEGFIVDKGKKEPTSFKDVAVSGNTCVHATGWINRVLVGLEEVLKGLEVEEVLLGPKGGASGSRGGASVSRRVEGRSRGGSSMSGGASRSTGRGSGRSGGANGSRGRGASRSRGKGAGGSKRKPVSNAGTQKRQGKKKVGTYGFAKWFGLQDEPEQT
ncbi:hypothetical protein Tco_0143666 [Tanacetum coccineum]